MSEREENRDILGISSCQRRQNIAEEKERKREGERKKEKKE